MSLSEVQVRILPLLLKTRNKNTQMAGKKGFKPNRGQAPKRRFIIAKKEDTCAETKRHIMIGEPILYEPWGNHKVYCKEATEYQKEAFDRGLIR